MDKLWMRCCVLTTAMLGCLPVSTVADAVDDCFAAFLDMQACLVTLVSNPDDLEVHCFSGKFSAVTLIGDSLSAPGTDQSVVLFYDKSEKSCRAAVGGQVWTASEVCPPVNDNSVLIPLAGKQVSQLRKGLRLLCEDLTDEGES